MVSKLLVRYSMSDPDSTPPVSRNLTWHGGDIGIEDRGQILGHKGCVVWFTGLSGSGKSTVARAVESRLFEDGRAVYVLDGDNVRYGLNADLGFSPEDRTENIRRVGEVALLMADAGLIVLAAFISPYRRDRDRIRERAVSGRFFEVFLDVPLAVCEERDPKGLYRKARAGEIDGFTGISAPYEPPSSPELLLETGRMPLASCAEAVTMMLEDAGIVSIDPAEENDE